MLQTFAHVEVILELKDKSLYFVWQYTIYE